MQSILDTVKKRNVLISCMLSMFILEANTCGKIDKDWPPDNHLSLTISNQSNRTVRYHIYWNYPDTTIGAYNPQRDGTDGLSPGEEFTDVSAGPKTCWESLLQDGKNEWVYIFDNDTLNAIPWDTVRATGRGLLERRLIDLDYLRSNDFRVVYKL